MTTSSGKKQTPWEHTSLVAEFYFNRSRNVPITIYSDQAVKDRGFVTNPGNPAHVILQNLRTIDWYVQNPAARSLTMSQLNGFSENECFLVGRALYSAADGLSKGAAPWIENFVTKVTGLHASKRKALLDGMLFEVFFNGDGILRAKPKGSLFNELFNLSKVMDLRPSFEFIADTLVRTGRRFHTFPDFDSDVSVDITTRTDAAKSAPVVTGILVGGRDILNLDDQDFVDASGTPLYDRISEAALSRKLATEVALPTLRQVVNYPDLPARPTQLLYPMGHSLRWAL